MTTEEGPHRGWSKTLTFSSPSSQSPSPSHRHSTSAFTKSKGPFQVVNVEGYGDDVENPKPKHRSRSGKTHTTIEMERETNIPLRDRPISRRQPTSSTSRSRPGRKVKRSDYNSDEDDAESIGSAERVADFNATTTTDTDGGNPPVIKTTTANLLAKEASQILGSPLQNG